MSAALCVAACQSVTGLDGLVFDRDEGIGGQGGEASASSGSMGQGASGQSSTGQSSTGQGSTGQGSTGQGGSGQGGSGQGGNGQGGSGGAPPTCTPPAAVPCSSPGGLAVAPKIIGTAPAGNVAIASSAGVFGVYSLTSFFTLNGSGQIQSPLSGPYKPVFRPRIAANNGGFAITMEYKPAGTDILGIVRFSLCGQETSTTTFGSAAELPTHADVIGGPGGFLVTVLPYTGMFTSVHASWLPDTGTPTATDFLGNVSCCTYQPWVTTLHGGSFQIAWRSSFGELQLTPVGTDGNVGTNKVLIPPSSNPPVFVGSVNNELVIVLASRVMRIATNGTIMSDMPISDQSACALATSGTELVRACRLSDNKIMLTRVNPSTGDETLLHTLVVTSASSAPAMAWDGAGYGIVWPDTGGLAFARVCGTP